MSTNPSLDLERIDLLLARVVRENPDKVTGWMQGQPGCWGFLAGKAINATRRETGRPLVDGERRLVWSRLWWLLERLKSQPSG